MAVLARWICDRDDSMFESKKDAEAHDKMLELGEQFATMLQQQIPSADMEQAAACGLFMAKHKDTIIEACKGKPELLSNMSDTQDDENNITPLHAEA
ncbi:MAG: YebG family protein [Gammaproteobacteria bacterium]|nr:YebG family protein [Gammaproteobacteria bacterium]